MDVLRPTPPREERGAGGGGGLLGPKDSVGDSERGIWGEGNDTLPALCAPGASPGRRGFRAANTFNNKERVYSRAIAFSHRRCSVPLESTLPNISAMYIWLIRMYIV